MKKLSVAAKVTYIYVKFDYNSATLCLKQAFTCEIFFFKIFSLLKIVFQAAYFKQLITEKI